MKMKLESLLIMSKEKKIGTSCCKNPKQRSKDWIGLDWIGWVFKNKIKQELFKLGAQGKPEKTGSFHTTSLYTFGSLRF